MELGGDLNLPYTSPTNSEICFRQPTTGSTCLLDAYNAILGNSIDPANISVTGNNCLQLFAASMPFIVYYMNDLLPTLSQAPYTSNLKVIAHVVYWILEYGQATMKTDQKWIDFLADLNTVTNWSLFFAWGGDSPGYSVNNMVTIKPLPEAIGSQLGNPMDPTEDEFLNFKFTGCDVPNCGYPEKCRASKFASSLCPY